MFNKPFASAVARVDDANLGESRHKIFKDFAGDEFLVTTP
jgi:hypothetical protein